MSMDLLKDLMAQYTAAGGSLTEAASYISTMASSEPTPFLRLNQWQSSDKPVMKDFNEDNRKIDEGFAALQAQKADKGSPKRYEIEFLSNFSKAGAHAASYTKTADNFVVVNLSVKNKRESEPISVGVHKIAVLPVGFRPVEAVVVAAATTSGKAGYAAFYTDGRIDINVRESVGSAFFSAVFPAEQ